MLCRLSPMCAFLLHAGTAIDVLGIVCVSEITCALNKPCYLQSPPSKPPLSPCALFLSSDCMCAWMHMCFFCMSNCKLSLLC